MLWVTVVNRLFYYCSKTWRFVEYLFRKPASKSMLKNIHTEVLRNNRKEKLNTFPYSWILYFKVSARKTSQVSSHIPDEDGEKWVNERESMRLGRSATVPGTSVRKEGVLWREEWRRFLDEFRLRQWNIVSGRDEDDSVILPHDAAT